MLDYTSSLSHKHKGCKAFDVVCEKECAVVRREERATGLPLSLAVKDIYRDCDIGQGPQDYEISSQS